MNKRGNILVNAILALSLTSVMIVSISKSVQQNVKLQDDLFDRNITLSFMESVAEDYIPLVYDDFYVDTYIEFNQEGSYHSFDESLMALLATLDNQDFLNCTITEPIKVGGFQDFYYRIVCTPPATQYTYEIRFNISFVRKVQGSNTYEILHEFIHYEGAPVPDRYTGITW